MRQELVIKVVNNAETRAIIAYCVKNCIEARFDGNKITVVSDRRGCDVVAAFAEGLRHHPFNF